MDILRLQFLVLVSLIFTGFSAYAQSRLTEDNVTAFIEKTTEITSGSDLDATEDDIQRYLERHLDPKARFRSVITYQIPGFDAQKKTLTLKKQDFIDFTLQGQKSLEHYDTTISVDKIRISKDGTKASVETSGFENGVMPVPTENGSQEVPVEGSSQCKQLIKLSKSRVIQMYNANCETIIQFSNF